MAKSAGATTLLIMAVGQLQMAAQVATWHALETLSKHVVGLID